MKDNDFLKDVYNIANKNYEDSLNFIRSSKAETIEQEVSLALVSNTLQTLHECMEDAASLIRLMGKLFTLTVPSESFFEYCAYVEENGSKYEIREIYDVMTIIMAQIPKDFDE